MCHDHDTHQTHDHHDHELHHHDDRVAALRERLHHHHGGRSGGRRHRGPGGWGGAPDGSGFFGPGPQRGPGGPGRPGGRGGRRGMVRVAVLALLADEPKHGYQLIQDVEARSGGRWRPSAGSIYPTLQLLEDQGLVTKQEADGRSVYALTDAGRGEAEEAAAKWRSLHEAREAALTDDPELASAEQLRGSFVRLASASWQVAQTGTDEQRAAAAALLDATRKQVYALLAED